MTTRIIETELERCAKVVRHALAEHAQRWNDVLDCSELRPEEHSAYRMHWENQQTVLQSILHGISNIQADNVVVG